MEVSWARLQRRVGRTNLRDDLIVKLNVESVLLLWDTLCLAVEMVEVVSISDCSNMAPTAHRKRNQNFSITLTLQSWR